MRCFAFWVALFLALPLGAQVQDEWPVPARTYNLLRENDGWSFLADPSLRSDFWDSIKYIRLGSEACYVSLGGEIREAFEQVGDDNWGRQRYMNAFLLQRYMLHSDWHLGENFRVFVQLKSGLEDFRAGGPRPIDEKRVDFEATFLEVGNTHEKNWAVLRIGRRELNYGSGRLVSVREGPNVRQSFDGVKIRSKGAMAWTRPSGEGFDIAPR
jgi:Alginate export